MIWFLRVVFIAALGSMIWVATWASLITPLSDVPPDVWRHPWFLITLMNAYWGLIVFYVWVAWKEQSTGARVLWFFAIVLLGTIAMAIYMIDELFSVDSHSDLTRIVAQRNEGKVFLPGVLVALAVAMLIFV